MGVEALSLLEKQVVELVAGDAKRLEDLLTSERKLWSAGCSFDVVAAHHDHELAELLHLAGNLRKLSEQELLMELGEFSRDTGFAVAENFQQIGQRHLNSVRSFVEDQSGRR